MKWSIEIRFPINEFIMKLFTHNDKLYIYNFLFCYEKSMKSNSNIDNYDDETVHNIIKFINSTQTIINHMIVTDPPIDNEIKIFNMNYKCIIDNYYDNNILQEYLQYKLIEKPNNHVIYKCYDHLLL